MTTAAGPRDRGAVATEYALLALLIAVVIVAAVTQLGARVDVMFADAAAALV